MSDLERRYRRLLAWYPRAHRREYEDEMLGVLLDAARPGQRRPDLRDGLDLVTAAVRMHVHRALGAGGALRSARPMIGLGLAGAGAALWAAVTTLVVPAARAGEEAALAARPDAGAVPNDRWLSLWVHDLRWAAIVVVVCGLALVAGGTGTARRLLPLACGTVLLVVDGAFTRVDATGWGACAVAGGLALALAAATVIALGTGLGAPGPDRYLLGYGITAACCAPLPLVNAHSGVQPFVSAGVVAGVAALPALLVLAAVACAAFAAGRVPRAALPGALAFAAVLAGAGLLAGRSEQIVWVMPLGGLLVAAVLAVHARWRPGRAALALAAGALGYPILALMSIMLGTVAAVVALALAADSMPSDGVAALPGGVVIGGWVGILSVVWAGRRTVTHSLVIK